jgi:hypothetical protein
MQNSQLDLSVGKQTTYLQASWLQTRTSKSLLCSTSSEAGAAATSLVSLSIVFSGTIRPTFLALSPTPYHIPSGECQFRSLKADVARQTRRTREEKRS